MLYEMACQAAAAAVACDRGVVYFKITRGKGWLFIFNKKMSLDEHVVVTNKIGALFGHYY